MSVRACGFESHPGNERRVAECTRFFVHQNFTKRSCEWTDMADIESQTNFMTLLRLLGMPTSEAVLTAFLKVRCSKKSSNMVTT